ncbi:TetR family transcriptional regulator [Tissierella sp. MB52-C2]|uniref:TetR family transcriptional regulator n=1 Tax=Tissierella sp. MB52-C2 TaxID=3070999 RepID=UPI00280A6726|nr:TetR family transcriptional regulator [Tissierella sp. MB52-C2]WMM26225.1 TetR family transcriptional regulator [Tissierella sp. MB52-C2]
MSPRVGDMYKQNRKEEILEAAKRVFIMFGYNKATMQDVIEEAKMSRGGVYAYFDNIEHVFVEVLKLDDKKDSKVFIEPVKGISLWTQLDEFLQLQQTEVENVKDSLVRAKSEFFLRLDSIKNKESVHYITKRYIKLKNAIEKFINMGIVQNEFNPVLPPESIALYMISFIDGLTLNSLNIGKKETRIDDQLAAFKHSLRSILRPETVKE